MYQELKVGEATFLRVEEKEKKYAQCVFNLNPA
jgi:hypothetical protein